MEKLLVSIMLLMFLSGCSGVSGSLGDTGPKCHTVVSPDSKPITICN